MRIPLVGTLGLNVRLVPEPIREEGEEMLAATAGSGRSGRSIRSPPITALDQVIVLGQGGHDPLDSRLPRR